MASDFRTFSDNRTIWMIRCKIQSFIKCKISIRFWKQKMQFFNTFVSFPYSGFMLYCTILDSRKMLMLCNGVSSKWVDNFLFIFQSQPDICNNDQIKHFPKLSIDIINQKSIYWLPSTYWHINDLHIMMQIRIIWDQFVTYN